ncbi:cell envelope integrity protein CreD [Lysobacter sp. CFH 32150]|uniref:cell envelope integrity protein CreD n=1 Tax=Lysobacter sp. CFH 32150 TaxID=2927128 RepID=UPI001FA7F2A2|nr:cell envelope integrity protein CreD [Lysobacter sp. CFH 32150]MCI4567507.1 cell envelope integrity protein CreD [Lysobacter sp. CFH 32150]
MRLLLKMFLVLGMTIAILVPLLMIRGTIDERQEYRNQAVASIAGSYAGAQAFAGPVLVVPYTETVQAEEKDDKGVVRQVSRNVDGRWTFFPATLVVEGHLRPELRRLGLHQVRVYEWQGRAQAAFRAQIPVDVDPAHPRRIGQPWLSYGIADVRGLVGAPKLRIDGRELALVEGFGSRDGSGVHVRLEAPAAGQSLQLGTQLDFVLGGTESLAIVPLARDNRFSLDSTWSHPRFGGSFLPRERRIGSDGFHARWEVSSLATGAQAQFLAGKAMPSVDAGNGTLDGHRAAAGVSVDGIDAIALSLVDPVNVYSQADRATKYGLLFVLLTFVGFFMFELIKQLPIHPIQYGLVGLALAIFFLLLVSLSEHIEFGRAYLISSVACIGLLGFYLSAVLRSLGRGLGFAAMLATLYAALYGLLVSEDNALVLGSGLLFVILAAIMVVTRKVDWYQLSARTLPRPTG